MSTPTILQDEPDFSLVLGGPLYQLFRRTRLCGDALELSHRRMLLLSGVVWLPLLALSAFAGQALGSEIEIPFLFDIETHVRLLIALPMLIGAELYVHHCLRPVVRQFVDRGIVAREDMPRLEGIIDSTLRVRNSVIGEATLVVFVYTVGLWVWQSQVALGTASWYATPVGDGMKLTAAGCWYFFVSLPIFQFIWLRWYLRFFLWISLLWRISRLNLRLVPLHPDRTAGLGFLGESTRAFVPILVAQGAILAGLIASRIFHAGQNLMDFRAQAAGFLAFFVLGSLIPLIVFMPPLARAKREGKSAFSKLAVRYARAFEDKWARGDATRDEELLGSADIQSLADLGNSFSAVQEMRVLPFGLRDVTRLAITTALPLLPLGLTMFSLEELVAQVFKVLF